MKTSGADVITTLLERQGVEVVAGIPGEIYPELVYGEFQELFPSGDDPTGVRVKFANLPQAQNTIKIYTLSGDLVEGQDPLAQFGPRAADHLRRFEILGPDGSLWAAATTLWLVLDLERRRPIRVPSRIVEALSRHDVGGAPLRPEPLVDPDPVEREAEFTVRRSDLDREAELTMATFHALRMCLR